MKEINAIYELLERGFRFGYYVYNVKYPYFHTVLGFKNDKYYYVHFSGSYCVKRDKDGIRTTLEIERINVNEFLRRYFPTIAEDITEVENILEKVKGWDE